MLPLQLLLAPLLHSADPAALPAPLAELVREMPRPEWTQLPKARDSRDGPSGYVQGLLGITELKLKEAHLDSDLGGTFDSAETASMPLIGGAVQRPLKGDKLQFGVEGGFMLGWQGNVEAVVIGNGSVAVAASNDIFLVEGFGGVYADLKLGAKARAYVGAGGLVDYARLDIEYDDPMTGYVRANADGFGLGLYTRAGFDFLLRSGMRVGFCWRWFDTDLNLGGQIHDVELDGMQYMLTFTRSM